jgi:hypothetical protein
MFFPTYWINKKLREALTSTGTVPRFAGMWYNDQFEVYMIGGEKFGWNPDTDEITLYPPYYQEINPIKIDTELVRQLYDRFIASKQKKKKVDPDAAIKEELGIVKRTLSDKDREQIEKYKYAMLSHKTNREESLSKETDGSKEI